MLDTLALWAFVPCVGTMALAWTRRSLALAIVSVGAVILFAQQFGVQVVSAVGLSSPVAASVAQVAPRVRVLTLNTYASTVERNALVEFSWSCCGRGDRTS